MGEPSIFLLSWEVFRNTSFLFRIFKTASASWRRLWFRATNPEIRVGLRASILTERPDAAFLAELQKAIPELQRPIRDGIKTRPHELEFTLDNTGYHFIIKVTPTYSPKHHKTMSAVTIKTHDARMKIFSSSALDELRSDFYDVTNIVRNTLKQKSDYSEWALVTLNKILCHGTKHFVASQLRSAVNGKNLKIEGIHGKDYRWAIASAVVLAESL